MMQRWLGPKYRKGFLAKLLLGASLCVSAAGCAHSNVEPIAARVQVQDPQQAFGELFVAVQTRRIFSDSKTFPDMEPLRSPADILADYRRERPSGDEDLRNFVSRNFKPVPSADAVAPGEHSSLERHIRALWPQLTRQPLHSTTYGSALPLPRSYVVPGGRFREIYYWDSYFTLLGLKADGRQDLLEDMIENFASLVERYGHVPNGTRSYYLSRSQPPFLSLMMGLSDAKDPDARKRRLQALRNEHAFWMRGESCATIRQACERVVRLSDGVTLNRYWDDRPLPRPESFIEDVETAAKSGREEQEVYRDLRAAAESGWDFSSRWLRDKQSLASIRTSHIVPADLNSLLFLLEARIAEECRETSDAPCAARFRDLANDRAAAIRKFLWVEDESRFADIEWATGKPIPGITAATHFPLFAGIADQHQADAVAEANTRELLAEGGLRTTTIVTGQQWDRPNGWAPLQWIAVCGLDRYGHHNAAKQISDRWLKTVERTFAETGKLLEKYDVEQIKPGGGGEYPTQDGFGWTNGVVRALQVSVPGETMSFCPGSRPHQR